MPSTRTRSILKIASRAARAGLVLFAVLLLVMVVFPGPLVRHALSLASRSLQGELRVREARFGLQGLGFQDLQLLDSEGRVVFTVARGTLGLAPWRILTSGRWLRGLGDLVLEEPALRVEVLEDGSLNLSHLLRPRPPGGRPVLADYGGTLRLRGGWVSFQDPRETGFQYRLEDASGTVAFQPGQPARVDLRVVPGESGELRLAGHFHPARPDLDLELTVQGLELRHLAEHPLLLRHLTVHGGRVEGKAWAAGRADGWAQLPGRLGYGGRLALDRGEIRLPGLAAPLRGIQARLELVPGLLRLEEARANLAGMGIRAHGRVSLPPGGRVDLLVSVPRARTAVLQELLGRRLPVEGQGRVDLAIAGPFSSPGATGVLKADRLRVKDQELREAELRFRLDGRLLRLDRVQARSGDGLLEGSGYVLLGPQAQVALTLSGQSASLAGLSPVGGQVDSFQLSVLGPASRPVVLGQGSGVSGFQGLGGLVDRVSGRFLYYDGGLVIVDGHAALRQGRVHVPFAAWDFRQADLSALVSTPGFQLPSHHLPGLGELRGEIRGLLQVQGDPTRLGSLEAVGLTRGTDLEIGRLAIHDLTGPVGLQDLQLQLGEVSGRAGGAQLLATGWIGLAGGSSNLVVQASGADLSALAGILEKPVPALLAGPGDLGLNWTSGGRGQENWVSLVARGRGGNGFGPYEAAGYGFGTRKGLGAVAWMRDLPLDGRPLTRDLELSGTLTGVIGAWGPPEDVAFDYHVALEDSELTGLRDGRLVGVGGGRVQGPWVLLDENLLAWEYDRASDPAASRIGLEGQAAPWYGPVLSSALTREPVAEPPLPARGSARVEGSFRLGRPPEYRLRYAATGVDLGWLASQDWLPEAGRLARSLNLRTGVARSAGLVTSDHGLPRLDRSSWVQVPWVAAGSPESLRGPQVFSAVGRVWSGPNRAGRPGPIHLDPLIASRNAADPALPAPGELDRWHPSSGVPEGLVVLAGRIDAPDFDLSLSGRGWDFSDALALAPAAAEFPSDLLTGRLETGGLKVRGRLGPEFLQSLDVTGSLAVVQGFVRLAGQTVPIQRLAATVERRHGELVLEDLALDSGLLHLEGRGTRSSAGRWQADLWAEEFPLSYLHYFGPTFTPLTGSGRMALFLDSGLNRPAAWLGFEGRDLAWQTDANRVEFPRLRLGALREIEGDGLRTGPGAGVRLDPTASGLALEIPPGGAEATARLEGQPDEARLSARGALRLGSLPEEGLVSWFTGPAGPDFGGDGVPFQVEVQDLQGNLLRALAGLAPSERRFTFSSTLSLLGQWHRDHSPLAQVTQPAYQLSVSRLELGVENGESWQGLALSRTMEARYRREGGLGRLQVSPFEMVPHGDPGPGRLEGQADLVLTRARGARDGVTNRLEFQARDLALPDLGFLLPGADRLGRIEELVLTATGPLLTPEVRMAMRLVGGRLGPLQIASLEGGMEAGPTAGEGGYQIRVVGPGGGPGLLFFGSQASAEQKVEFSGQVPLAVEAGPEPAPGRLEPVWTGARVSSGGELHLLARMTDSGLRLLDDFVPGLSSTSGRLEGELALSGTLARPELAGRLSIENGQVLHDQAGGVTDLQVRTLFEEIPPEEAHPTLDALPPGQTISRLSIERFEGRVGGKPFTVKGAAEMAGLDPVNVAVSLEGKALPLRWGDLFNGVADVGLDLIARPGRREGQPGTTLIPVVTGQVQVRQGDLEVPLLGLEHPEPAAEARPLPVDYRVRLDLGDDVWVHALNSRIRAQGELWVLPHPTTNQPVLAGSVDLSRGLLTVPFYDVSFRVNRGRAPFDRSRIPTLENVEAETELAGYQVIAYVNGTFPDLRFDFVSNPPLAQGNIQRLLAVGTVSPVAPGMEGMASQEIQQSDLGNAMTGRGLALVSQMLTAPISQEIGRMFFLTEFSFDFVPPYSFVFKVAKALDDRDRFLLTLTRIIRGGVGQDESLYGLEWRFQQNLLMRVATDQFGELRTWFQGIWDF